MYRQAIDDEGAIWFLFSAASKTYPHLLENNKVSITFADMGDYKLLIINGTRKKRLNANYKVFFMINEGFNEILVELKKFIPIQKKGRYSDTYSSLETKELCNPDISYNNIRNRLLDINNWAYYATLTNTDFILLDEMGNKLNRLAAEGDFMKVRFSRLQRIISTRHDFVRVNAIHTVYTPFGDAVVMQLQPSPSPEKPESEVDHFFTAAASNTFVLYRTVTEIHLSVHGRNEQPNLKVSKTGKKIRNMVFAVLGMLAVSKAQWKSLVHGLLNYNEKIL